MAAGTLIKVKRKAGAFTGGELSAGEFGLDVTNTVLFQSIDGSTVFSIDPAAAGDALVANGLDQFAATTSAELAGVISDETGTGLLVFNDSPNLDTPDIGVATADSVNKVVITAPATSATFTLADGSTLVVAGAYSTTLTSTATTNVTLPTTGTLANQAYVDAAVVGLADLKGGYDANTNTPDLDVSPSGIKHGDTYRITAAGLFFSTQVEIGDTVVADQDDPTLVGHWTILQTNLDGAALTANSLAQFASTTSAEVLALISDETGTGVLVFGTGPTIDSPVISTIINTGTLTLPTSTDTLTGRATTDTLSNKTISDATNTIDGGTI